ncbi:hypothetical protein ACJD0Z_11400 [Flavobacteriaceae bacterium M23B6Z8]
MEAFENQLKGGHPNSLGNTVAVVEIILANPQHFDELFNCYFSEDEVVRLRVSNAMKRICKENKILLLPYLDRFLSEIAAIDQASTQWTLAQLFGMLEKEMHPDQLSKAKSILKNNLATHDDWIVLNQTMDTLVKWAKKDEDLQAWLPSHLKRLTTDPRKSVASKAQKSITALQNYK